LTTSEFFRRLGRAVLTQDASDVKAMAGEMREAAAAQLDKPAGESIETEGNEVKP
jgi:hypothetical protein